MSIANQLDNHYINLGNQLAESIPCHNTTPVSYIKRSFQHSFMFRPIDSNEICDLIMNLKVTKSVIGLPQKIIKLACDYITEPLTEIFNQSLLRGVVPEILKI
jgi:hypothetical protein